MYDKLLAMILWDEAKRISNLNKHGLDFADLTPEFFEGAVVFPSYGSRFVAVGELRGETIIAVVFLPLGTEALSIVSMRLASRKERRLL